MAQIGRAARRVNAAVVPQWEGGALNARERVDVDCRCGVSGAVEASVLWRNAL